MLIFQKSGWYLVSSEKKKYEAWGKITCLLQDSKVKLGTRECARRHCGSLTKNDYYRKHQQSLNQFSFLSPTVFGSSDSSPFQNELLHYISASVFCDKNFATILIFWIWYNERKRHFFTNIHNQKPTSKQLIINHPRVFMIDNTFFFFKK